MVGYGGVSDHFVSMSLELPYWFRLEHSADMNKFCDKDECESLC